MPRVLIVSDEHVRASMAGPAIRFYEFARELAARGHRVTLTTPGSTDLGEQPFALVTHDATLLRLLAAEHDVIVLQGWTLAKYPFLEEAEACIIADLYDPFPLEALVIFDREPMEAQIGHHGRALDAMLRLLRRGDRFLCASEMQRDLWLGALTAVDRVGPVAHADDPSLRSLIDVVPFGVPAEPPRRSGPGPRALIDGIDAGDLLLLWGGGIYNWFDPLTLLEGVALAAPEHPDLRLLFMSTAHPNPDTPPMWMLDETRRRAASLGLLGRHVFFNDTWVPYAKRADWLLDADAGVSTNQDHVEARFAFRTRILDYLWAGLPVLCTAGDALARTVEEGGMGVTVPAEDAAAIAAAIGVLADAGVRGEKAERARAHAATLHWPALMSPLIRYCAAPSRAPDRGRRGGAPADGEAVRARLDDMEGRLRKAEAQRDAASTERDRLAAVVRATPGSRLVQASLQARGAARRWLPPGTRRRALARDALEAARRVRGTITSSAPAVVTDPAAAAYREWCREHDATEHDLARQREAADGTAGPSVLVVVTGSADTGAAQRTVDSVEAQTWPHRRTATVADRFDTAVGVGAVDGLLRGGGADLACVLEAGDVLSPDCLFEVAAAARRDPLADVVLWDDDVRGSDGVRRDPRFRPEWSPDMLLCRDVLGRSFAIRPRRVEAAGGLRAELAGAATWDLLLRAELDGERAVRIPRVLTHLRARVGDAGRAGLRAVTDRVTREDPDARAELDRGAVRVRWPLPDPPAHVTVIVPTRHNRPMVERCLRSLARTDYPSFDVAVVDSGERTTDNESWYTAAFAGVEVTVSWWERPFNYSAVNNAAARDARGDVLLFLNDDTEVLDPAWMREMVGWALRPGIGAVGTHLLAADGTIQHAGAVVGLNGFADHVFEGMAPDADTMLGPVRAVRDLLAVTAACLAIRRDRFEETGGFDERFVLCGSDVVLGIDQHLRGRRNVCLPFTPLRHLGSATRGTEVPASDFFASWWRYAPWVTGGDPYHSPNLSVQHKVPTLRQPDEPPATALAGTHLGRRFDVYRQRDDSAEAMALARSLGATRDDAAAVRALHGATRGRQEPRRVTWFLPELDSPFYGGVSTLLRIADHLLRHHGVESSFASWGAGPDAYVSAAIAAAFPRLAGSTVVCHDGSDRALGELPEADVAIASFWATAYQVARFAGARRKFYLIQDYEPMFYPAGAVYALSEETYRLGLYGICNTVTLRDLYRDTYAGCGAAFVPAVDRTLYHAEGRVERGEDDPVTLFVYARPGHWRNCWEMAAPALLQLKDRLGDRLRIVTAGSWAVSDDLRERMAMRQLGLLDHRATGPLYRRCDIGMALTVSRHPSYLPLELMACGVPVVAFDNPNWGWLLRDGENCLLAEQSVGGLVRAVEALVRDEELRRRLSRRAAADIAERHGDWDVALAPVWDFLCDPEGRTAVRKAGPEARQT